MAPNRAVHGEAALAGLDPRDGELIGQVHGRAEVRLAGHLAGERRMRHPPVVLLDEEGDQRGQQRLGTRQSRHGGVSKSHWGHSIEKRKPDNCTPDERHSDISQERSAVEGLRGGTERLALEGPRATVGIRGKLTIAFAGNCGASPCVRVE